MCECVLVCRGLGARHLDKDQQDASCVCSWRPTSRLLKAIGASERREGARPFCAVSSLEGGRGFFAAKGVRARFRAGARKCCFSLCCICVARRAHFSFGDLVDMLQAVPNGLVEADALQKVCNRFLQFMGGQQAGGNGCIQNSTGLFICASSYAN